MTRGLGEERVCLGLDANTQARSDGAREGRQVDGAGYEGGHAETDHIKHKYAGSTGQTGRELGRLYTEVKNICRHVFRLVQGGD